MSISLACKQAHLMGRISVLGRLTVFDCLRHAKTEGEGLGDLFMCTVV